MDIRIYFWLKGNILALIHLRVLLLNKYEISSIYVIMFGDNHVQSGWNWKKRGDTLRYYPGIKNLIKNKSCRLISTKKCHSKEYIHIDIIAPNFKNFYRRIFKIFKIMFFMDGTQKNEIVEGKLLHTHTLLLLYLWDKKN